MSNGDWARGIARVVVISLRGEGAQRRAEFSLRLNEWGIVNRTLIHSTDRLIRTEEPSLRVRMGELGCAVGHREAVELAADLETETVLVLEDDAEVFPGGLEETGRVMEALAARDDWDAVNLGGCRANWRPGTPAFGSQGHVPGVTRRVSGMVATHAVVYHRRFYEALLCAVPGRAEARAHYASLVKPAAYDEWLHQAARVVAPIKPCFYQTGEESAILHGGRHVIDVRAAIEEAGELLAAAEAGEEGGAA